MNDELQNVIAQSTFEVVDGTYIYAHVRSVSQPEKHFMVARDRDEITVVTAAANLEGVELLERNREDYTLIALNVSVPFYCVGFIAAVGDALAAQGMNILVVSTYSKDYVLVRKEDADNARHALLALGFTERVKH